MRDWTAAIGTAPGLLSGPERCSGLISDSRSVLTIAENPYLGLQDDVVSRAQREFEHYAYEFEAQTNIEAVGESLLRSFDAANQVVLDEIAHLAEAPRISIVAAVVAQGFVVVGRLGSGQAHLLRDGHMESLFGSLLTFEPRASHREHDSFLGDCPAVYPEKKTFRCIPGDTFLITTNHLFDAISRHDLQDALASASGAERAAELLAHLVQQKQPTQALAFGLLCFS